MNVQAKSMISRRTTIILLLFFLPVLSFSQTFNSQRTTKLRINPMGHQNNVVVGTEDCLLIELPDDMSFIGGIELSFKMPSEIVVNKDCLSWTVFENLASDSPSEYSGEIFTSGNFGGNYSFNMKIPLHMNFQIKKDAYSHLLQSIPEVIDGKLFLRIQSNNAKYESKFRNCKIKVSGKPIFMNQGKLIVETSGPKEKVLPYTLLIDGVATNYCDEGLKLVPGVHTVGLVSDFYRSEHRTISIEQGKTQTLRIDLQSITPLLKIVAPDGTKVYIDEKPIQNFTEPHELPQGEHSIRFMFGNYETVKSISTINGRSYRVSIFLDAQIDEE